MILARHFLKYLLLISAWCVAGQTLLAAEKIPLGHEGRRHSAVYNGHQNMPVVLYGVAIDWNKDCLKGKADKCLRLARGFEIGQGDLKLEVRAALGYYLRACEKGAAAGCNRAAEIIRAGEAGFTDNDLARKTAERGCSELGDQASCAGLAESLRIAGRPEDKNRAQKLIDMACDKGNSEGCRLKATSLFYDDRNASSLGQAVDLFEKFCKKRMAWACTGMAEAFLEGRGQARNENDALKYARRGCLDADGNTIPACALLGRLLTGGGSSGDLELGVKLLVKACLAGDAYACNDAGELGPKNSNSRIAQWEVPLFFRDACDMDLARGCLNLSDIYKQGLGTIRLEPAPMIALLDKACRLGSAEACDRVTALGEVRAKSYRRRLKPIDPSLPATQQLAMANQILETVSDRVTRNRALDAVIRLMQEGVAEANWMLGGWLYYGKPGVINQANKNDGFILFENAARQQHVEAAKWVGMAYWYGDGVPLDRKKGEGYMALAAARGDEMAIAIYRSMKAEKIREDKARREREMAEAAERRKNDWSYQFGLAAAAWAQGRRNTPYSYGGGSSGRLAGESWQRSQQALDKMNWNNAVNYTMGRTNACPISNPYC
ncbi:tetratricopeptide repeat protein [Emcibacter nanhaiensis]|uniref:Sel1 repeat family protein n=1 Tax=Emcibacter nanhaiensis TaxID=1505037 RepID=A0A501P916_9PROT|nr:SEL1-like repeat protein [Emcibacter nanhaiensis]TPD56829.1 sel1 repeat family protein [Emcibacter nanhaiensis]